MMKELLCSFTAVGIKRVTDRQKSACSFQYYNLAWCGTALFKPRELLNCRKYHQEWQISTGMDADIHPCYSSPIIIIVYILSDHVLKINLKHPSQMFYFKCKVVCNSRSAGF